MLTDKDAVIVVDYQNDFLPGGALGVKDGDEIAVAINRIIQCNKFNVFTQDWHPDNHCSFGKPPKYVDGSWPKHCVENTFGAEISDLIDLRYRHAIVHKGMDASKEAYSGFSGRSITESAESLLDESLIHMGIERVFICGLALDYCVKATAIDAVEFGYDTYILTDAVMSVSPENDAELLQELRSRGVRFIETLEVIPHE